MVNFDTDTTQQFVGSASMENHRANETTFAHPKRMNSIKIDKATNILSGTFGSRGSLMLKAALGDRSRNYTITQPRDSGAARSKRDELDFAQQALLKNCKKWSKQKVLFRDPVVTSEHKYEPTFVDPFVARRPSSSIDSDDSGTSTPSKSSPPNQSHLPPHSQSTIPPIDHGCHDNSSESNGGDEELFSPALSTSQEATSKSPLKRLHDDAMGSGDEDLDNPRQIKRSPAASEPDDSCLFSSPKVAKIAPYYHDNTLATDLKSAHKSSPSASRFQSSQRANPRRLNPRTSLNKPTNNHLMATVPHGAEPETSHASHFENIDSAVEKATSQPIVDSTGSYQQFYFGWISSSLSYLSSQMNKLIF